MDAAYRANPSRLRVKYAREADETRKAQEEAEKARRNRKGIKCQPEDQSLSPGHLEGSKVKLIAEQAGIGLFEESKGKLIYGYTLAVMPAKNKDYGRNAWYLPNWVLDYAIAAMPKLGAELAKPKKEQRALREVLQLHQIEWRAWLAAREPLPPVRRKK